MEQKLVHFGEGTTAPNASAEQQHVEYEVFLSFRGPDVRKSFADFLYSYFVHSKIRTFRDEEELQKGEIIAPSLVQAITESKIYIPILSKSYASSKWCLQELAKMVECCRKGKGHIIFPVFYFMDPRDVRHQAGPYEEAFEQHSKKHDAVIIQDWRITLQEVGQMKGWHVTELDGNKRVVEVLPEYKLYEPKEMSHDHSLQLFSRHAFGMHYPPEGYAALCDEFVKVSANLPLALKVIGSLMFRRDRQFWEEKLMQLREVPGSIDKVQHRLKISYNELTYEEKEIFLDIACFFIGEDKELPVHMWSDKELYPESVIRTLILRSLIKLDGTNRIWMHDHLRDLGRAIVIEEDVGNPYKRSRIWSKNDAICMLKNKKGTDRVQMLRVDAESSDPVFLTNNSFKGLSNLRYLDINHPTMAMNGDFRGVLPSLFWIKLSCFYNPFNLNLKNVVILELQGWDIFDGWQGWNSVKMARKLKIINLRGSFNLLMLPDLSRCGNLESIDLTLCRRTRGKLNISAFRNLKVVMLQDTKIALTGDMGKLQKLEEIRTGDIWQLPKLKTLKMVKCSCKGSLLSDQDGLLPSSLTCLVVDWSRGLTGLPNLANLSNLMELRLFQFSASEIRGLGKLRVLETLEISESMSLDHLHGLDDLVHLKELTLKSCGLDCLPSLSNLIRLHKLVIVRCPLLSEIPGLGELKRLETLDVSGCIQLVDVTGLDRLKSLQKLNMPNCCAIDELPDISGMKNLEVLDVSECIKLVRVTGLVKLESLEELYMVDCKSINELPDMSNLRNLMKLNLKGCKKLKNVKGLEKLHLLWFVRMGNRLHLKYPLKTVAWASREVAVSLFGRAFMKEHEELTSWYHKQIKDRR
ncbi:Disease resistance protein L6 [Linum grandiflorum]